MGSDENGNLKPTENSSSSKVHYKFLHKLWTFILIVVAFFSYLIVVPLFIVLVSPLYLYRFFVIFLAKIFRPDFIKIVNTRDAVVGLDKVTEKCLCMLNVILTFHGEPDIEHIRDFCQKKVMEVKNAQGEYTYQKFKYYYESWLGFAFWKEVDNFNLNDHIRFCEETEAENNNCGDEMKSTTEKELMEILGPISTRPFAPKTSPWEFLIVRNYVPSPTKVHTDLRENIMIYPGPDAGDSKKQFAVIFRVHHALGDGYSLMKLLLVNWGQQPASKLPKVTGRKMSFLTRLYMYAGIILLSPYYHLRQFVLDVDRNFWHKNPRKLTREWQTTMSEKISLDTIKNISKAQKVSGTAVLVGGFSGAVRKYMQASGLENKIPEVMRALAPMPWQNHPMDSLVNHWTLGNMVLPVGYSCPKERLKIAEKSIRFLKQSPALLVNFGTVPLLLGGPSLVTDIWATNWMTTMVLSNFAGPDFMMKIFERYPGDSLCFFLPQMRGKAGIGVGIMSYNNGVRITVTVDKAIIPDAASADLLRYFINEEFQCLKALVTEVIV